MSKTVRDTWVDAKNALTQELKLNSDEARFEAQLLLQTAVQVNRAWLLAHEEDALQASIHTGFQALLQRRLKGEPVAHILGRREFYGLDLIVTPDTLIPRPDTELLVETALNKIPQTHCDNKLSILDLGTGSGAIALAIARHRPHISVTAVDIAPAALEIARQNAQKLGITHVRFVSGRWFDGLAGEKFDFIVSNPPYITSNDAHLSQGDLRFEPVTALASGEDGLDDIRHIITHSLSHLKPQGWLMLEHGYNQAEQVADLMAQAGLTEIVTLKDWGGNNRVTMGMFTLVV